MLVRVPTGRLVVLGEPGSGKTMLMVRLVLDLLTRRAGGGPVPILASLASWNPADQNLHGWLGATLITDHPALADPPPDGMQEPTQAAALLNSGLIVPILDGLDEIPEQVRGPAISRINDALRPGVQLVVTCRTQQYRDVVRPPGGVEVTLRGAAAVQLRPLDADAVRDYLCDSAPGPVARTRWAPVLAVLGTETPAGQALRMPLMVGLACAIYNPRPGGHAGKLPDPAELCDFADRSSVEAHLFDAFIPAAYQHDPADRWKAQDAERWLVFLARHLERKIAGPDLAWWKLRQAMSSTLLDPGLWAIIGAGLWLIVGAGLGFGVADWLKVGFWGSIGAGLGAGVIGPVFVLSGDSIFDPDSPFASKKTSEEPSRGMRISVFGLVGGLGGGFIVGLLAGLCVGIPLYVGGLIISGVVFGFRAAGHGGIRTALVGRDPGTTVTQAGISAIIGAALVTALVMGLEHGLKAVPGDLTAAESPQTVLARDRWAALRLMLVTGVMAGVLAGIAGSLAFGIAGSLAFGIAGGLGAGLFVSGTRTAWPSYIATIGWLALHHRLPWSLMDFLADARERGILRQAGTVFQFRHIDLQHRLATRP